MSLEGLFIGSFENHEYVEAILQIVESVIFLLNSLQVGDRYWWRSIPRNPVI